MKLSSLGLFQNFTTPQITPSVPATTTAVASRNLVGSIREIKYILMKLRDDFNIYKVKNTSL
jgi:hypothetical protein